MIRESHIPSHEVREHGFHLYRVTQSYHRGCSRFLAAPLRAANKAPSTIIDYQAAVTNFGDYLARMGMPPPAV